MVKSEDYRILVLDFGDAPKDMSSIDASLSNAYPTLLADNGPRHFIDPAKRLGALIDSELDGQPNLAANGDDITTWPTRMALPSTQRWAFRRRHVILSGVENNLVVTASTAGFLSAWIDYNQNGTFTDPGEQLFNDQAVAAGANTLNFTTPNTAPHGTTYMRFRYSTQNGVANTVTGLAPDGEVEDYRVEVALPAPQSCAAGLVNGSFEAPVVGAIHLRRSTAAAGYPSGVPMCGWIPSSPSAAAISTNATPLRFGPTAFKASRLPGQPICRDQRLHGRQSLPGSADHAGSTLAWQFAHRGRNGTDVMAVKIGAPGATVTQRHPTDGNTQWGLYSGSYIVPAGQTITRFEFQAVSSAGGNASVGNLVDASVLNSVRLRRCAGLLRHDAERQRRQPRDSGTLRLGSFTDAEGTGFPSVNASGDNLNALNDEDGLAALPPLNQANTAYTLVRSRCSTVLQTAVTLYGWIDFNRNGQFEAGEGVSTTVPSSATAQAIPLTWSGVSGLVPGRAICVCVCPTRPTWRPRAPVAPARSKTIRCSSIFLWQ